MIKTIPLAENTSVSKNYKSKHGLSLYIETDTRKILFDVGPNGVFLENARQAGVDIASVDTVVISHGHRDHAGGLGDFMKANKNAKIYIRKSAFDKHYIKVMGIPVSVSADASLAESVRFVFTDETTVIDDEISVFSDVTGDMKLPSSDSKLYMKANGKLVRDDFCHEQNLCLHADGKTVLFAGCSHAGIVNICQKAADIYGKSPDIVVGGFHLFNPPTRKYESDAYISETAKALAETKSRFYTCHCTGEKAFRIMKKVLGDRLEYISTGSVTVF